MISVCASDFPPSKSIYNRALIFRTFHKDLKIKAASDFCGDDVLSLKKALELLENGATEFDCGSGAAPLKFLAIRMTRLKGAFVLRGSERLFSRPLDGLLNTLKGLGASELVISKDSLSFASSGEWPKQITINPAQSSQELSAVVLSSWDLDSELTIDFSSPVFASLSYLDMTFNMMKAAGWAATTDRFIQDEKLVLPKKQSYLLDEIFIEPDMSCIAAFVLAGLLVRNSLQLSAMVPDSMQGDFQIFKFLSDMGFNVQAKKLKDFVNEGVLSELSGLCDVYISKGERKSGITVDLFSVPDLFPVLSAFCVSLNEPSTLKGLENLNIKESKRFEKICDLLIQVGVEIQCQPGILKIYPQKEFSNKFLNFDSDQDHRLAMAAEMLRLQGAKIDVLNPNVVSKSFPNFWSMLKAI